MNIRDFKDSFTNRSTFGFVKGSSKIEERSTQQPVSTTKVKPLWEQLQESQKLKDEEMEEKFRNLPPRGLEAEDIQFLEDYKKKRYQVVDTIREQENIAAQAFSQEIARTVITLEDKQKQYELSQTAAQLIKEKQNKAHTLKDLDLNLSQVIIVKKKKRKAEKKGATDADLSQPQKKKPKVEQTKENNTLLSLVPQYESSDDESKQGK
jgi:predicted acetyltransferase